MKVIKFEVEVTKLSRQQNLQQRIHHYTNIREENNALKSQNEELSCKLRRNDAILIQPLTVIGVLLESQRRVYISTSSQSTMLI
ncbi:kinesin motor domain-containing protein [Artemisia annua]|uniref:Kinesin motor domain-containing protein n=1 Tax=Artemisia annua TaxID=35608 RepID=A0A2U1Q7P9_ARTAN|nr:kinesin motor domain-containing protein [Artemisia annua]